MMDDNCKRCRIFSTQVPLHINVSTKAPLLDSDNIVTGTEVPETQLSESNNRTKFVIQTPVAPTTNYHDTMPLQQTKVALIG